MTEGTTRILETPDRKNNPFGQNSYEQYEQPGSLAQATSRISPQANPTVRSLELEKKRPNWLLIGSMSVAVLALIAVVVLLATRNSTTTVSLPRAATRPGLPPIPPPNPPSAPIKIQEGGTAISPEFIYPGSTITLEVRDAKEGSSLQLQTTDPFDKVVNWYTEKLKPEQIARQGETVALNTKQMKAVLTNAGPGEVIIILHQGED